LENSPPERIYSELTCEGHLKNLPLLVGFVKEACERSRLGEEQEFAFHLAVDEVCVNIIRHGYAGGSNLPIHLRFEADDTGATLQISDEAPHFSPSDAPTPDLDAGWEQRPVGGLGWHLVSQLMDEVRHEPLDPRGNRVTLIKNR